MNFIDETYDLSFHIIWYIILIIIVIKHIYFLFLFFVIDNWMKKVHRLCPYLDTINRQLLDFDFEKLCSVSLSRINVYACLVCGKYFQGNINVYIHL